MSSRDTLLDAVKKKLQFDYDQQGRRIRKLVYQWDPAQQGYLAASETRFLYDGWNLLAELDADGKPIRTYLPRARTKVSGTAESASGGVLAVFDGEDHAHFTLQDGMGNVIGWMAADPARPSAQYRYGTFGEPLGLGGPEAARHNPIRFASQYSDPETGLVYFGHRYYQPSLGRFLSQDPLHDPAFSELHATDIPVGFDRERLWLEPNPYMFALNNPLGYEDWLGLCSCPCPGGRWIGTAFGYVTAIAVGWGWFGGTVRCAGNPELESSVSIAVGALGAFVGTFLGVMDLDVTGADCPEDLPGRHVHGWFVGYSRGKSGIGLGNTGGHTYGIPFAAWIPGTIQ
jgi:RHS repeat-associated protein